MTVKKVTVTFAAPALASASSMALSNEADSTKNRLAKVTVAPPPANLDCAAFLIFVRSGSKKGMLVCWVYAEYLNQTLECVGHEGTWYQPNLHQQRP